MNVDVFGTDWEAKYAYYYIGHNSGKPCRFTTDIKLEVGLIVVMQVLPYGTALFQVKNMWVTDGMSLVEFQNRPKGVARAIEIRDLESMKQYDVKVEDND